LVVPKSLVRVKKDTKNMGMLSWFVTGSLRENPFQSESLDDLAETMQVNRILKKGRLKRYYKSRFLQAGGLSSFDRIFFDAKYLQMLSPDELLAIGAHEFTHINEKHGEKRLLRIFGRSLVIAAAIGAMVFFNFAIIEQISFFSNFGRLLSSFFFSVILFWIAFWASFYLNSRWNREQEIKCDLSAVKFANGEAMISALIKLNQLRPRKMTRLNRLLPTLYPTLDQRINAIRKENEKP
jgi:Zn-dependent protease with chaperone function